MSQLVAEQARRLGVTATALEQDGRVRKECVDQAFGSLLQRIKSSPAENAKSSAFAPTTTTTTTNSSSKKPAAAKRQKLAVAPQAAAVELSEDEDEDEDFEDQPKSSRGRGSSSSSRYDDDGEEEDIEPERGEEEDDDDDANSENLEDFSGMEDLDLDAEDDDGEDETSSNFPKRTKLKPAARQPKRKDYAPVGRKQRGYHKLAGLFVCVLSTGETGYVLKRPGGRVSLKLQSSPQPVPSSAEKLFVLTQQPTSAKQKIDDQQMIDEMYDACRHVPQVKDLELGQRVAVLNCDNATGRVTKLPALDGSGKQALGHVTVQLDKGKEEKRVVIEMLRIVDDDHVTIAQSSWAAERTKPGRPTKAEMARKPVVPAITALVPHSKRGEAWRRQLRPARYSDREAAAQFEAELAEEDRQMVQRKPAAAAATGASAGAGGAPPPPAVKLGRGKKLCHACEAQIGTASKTCGNCNTPCVPRETKNKV